MKIKEGKGRPPWIIDPKEDGGKDLEQKLNQIREIAYSTDNETQIQAELGISHETWHKYKRKHLSDFTEAIAQSWNRQLLRVQNKAIEKALKGNSTMIKFVLERKSDWLERHAHELSGKGGDAFEIVVRDYRAKRNKDQDDEAESE